MMPTPFSRARRNVVLAGLASAAAPALLRAAPPGSAPRANAVEARGRLVVSGRIVSRDGEALPGAAVELWHANEGATGATTDADGRFVVVTNAQHPARLRYRVAHRGRSTEGSLPAPQRDHAGTWRATFGLMLA
jgi:hypothetical protein